MNRKKKWSQFLNSKIKLIITMWKKLPEQITRIILIVVFFIIVFFITRALFVPEDFGKYGHYRASALDEIISTEIKYAGQEICNDCHDDIFELKTAGYHNNLSCEICHGPAAGHTEDPDSIKLPAPRKRAYCPLCHEYLPSRPTGFPQIVSASHNPMKSCISCHDPHDPIPLETPKECAACHAEIARAKSVSHHMYIPCTKCHQTADEHKLRPRDFIPTKPKTRAFCGQCHGIDADSEKGIPRVDLETHERRYVCWQCHYPHLPEAR
jgi:hypothetical protein